MSNQSKILVFVYILFAIFCYTVESMMWLGMAMTAFAIAYLCYLPFSLSDKRLAKENADKNRLLTEYDNEFESDHSFVTIDEKIAVSESGQIFKIYKIDTNNKIVESKIRFDQIMDSEIVMDNNIVLQASRGEQIGGALIGSMVAGGVGAIIGASSPTQTQLEGIKSIQLRIRIDDFKNPNFTFDFLPTAKQLGVPNFEGYSKSSKEYKTAYEQAELWHSLLEIAIRKTNNKVSV